MYRYSIHELKGLVIDIIFFVVAGVRGFLLYTILKLLSTDCERLGD